MSPELIIDLKKLSDFNKDYNIEKSNIYSFGILIL